MQTKKARRLVIGSSFTALINFAAPGAASALDTDSPPPHKHKHKTKADEPIEKDLARQLQALRDQIDASQHRLDAQTVAEQQAAYEPVLADRTLHAEVYGLHRSFCERLEYSNTDHGGGGIGGGLAIPLVRKILDFHLSGMVGKGIGRYGSGQLSDVTFDQAGNIEPISEVMGLAGFTLHATPVLGFYLFAGEEKESAQPYDVVSKGIVTAYGYGNPLYVNSGCESKVAAGACTANNRVYGTRRYGVQYSYSERKAFDGKGKIGAYARSPMTTWCS